MRDWNHHIHDITSGTPNTATIETERESGDSDPLLCRTSTLGSRSITIHKLMSVPSMVIVDFSLYFVVDDEIVLLPSDRRVDRVGMEYA